MLSGRKLYTEKITKALNQTGNKINSYVIMILCLDLSSFNLASVFAASKIIWSVIKMLDSCKKFWKRRCWVLSWSVSVKDIKWLYTIFFYKYVQFMFKMVRLTTDSENDRLFIKKSSAPVFEDLFCELTKKRSINGPLFYDISAFLWFCDIFLRYFSFYFKESIISVEYQTLAIQ